MNLKEGQVDKMWEKLGFDIDKTKRDVTAVLTHDDVVILRSKRSHGSGKLSGNVQHYIRQQMKLDDHQFADAYNCPLQKPEYLEILKAKGLIPERTEKPEPASDGKARQLKDNRGHGR